MRVRENENPSQTDQMVIDHGNGNTIMIMRSVCNKICKNLYSPKIHQVKMKYVQMVSQNSGPCSAEMQEESGRETPQSAQKLQATHDQSSEHRSSGPKLVRRRSGHCSTMMSMPSWKQQPREKLTTTSDNEATIIISQVAEQFEYWR